MNPENHEINEKIAQLIASLPSDHLLQPDLMTEDQINEWQQLRNVQLLIAECWRAKFLIGQGDPIVEALDKKDISQHKYDLIWFKVNLNNAQWELCKVAGKDVKQAHEIIQNLSKSADSLPNPLDQLWHKLFKIIFLKPLWHKLFKGSFLKPYPFETAYDLFAETLREETDGCFSWCLASYYDLPIKKWREATKQLSKICDQSRQNGIYPKLNAIEAQKLKSNLVWGKVDFSWLGMTLLVCQLAAWNNPLLKGKLVEYNRFLKKYFTLAFTASRKLRGFTWNKGEEIPASQAGGVYRKA
jgi:hypothetical protein